MRARVTAGALVVAALAVAAPLTPAQAAPVIHEVAFGKFTTGVDAEVLRAFPSTLRVHSGDTVHFSADVGPIAEAGIHWTGLLPEDVAPDDWVRDQGTVLEGPWAVFLPDPDEKPDVAPEAWKLNARHVFPTDPNCGHTAETACDFDGSGDADQGVLGSGVGFGRDTFLDYYARITAKPGTTVWAVCGFHPGIRVRIDVVADDEPVTEPADVEAAAAAALANYERKALALHERYVDARVSRRGPNGTRIWQAWPGRASGPIFLGSMYPASLTVRPGDTVQFNFPRNEIHTVSLPVEASMERPWLVPMCDLDGDSGGAQDVEALPVPPFCPGATLQVEFDLDHTFPFPVGDGAVTDTDDFETSGVRGGGFPGLEQSPFRVRFDAPSTGKGYEYVCMLHSTMRGFIVVR